MLASESKLSELRELLRRIESSGVKRAEIARKAGVDASKICKLLGTKKSGFGGLQGINGETALRLWIYAHSWLRKHEELTRIDDAASPSPSTSSIRVAAERFGSTGIWKVTAKIENKLSLPGDLALIVSWLDSGRETTSCIAISRGPGDRVVLPRAGSFNKKIETFDRLFQHTPATAEEIIKNTERIRLRRYLDAAWSLTITHADTNEYELEVTTPRGAIKVGSEVDVWALQPEGLVLMDPEKVGSNRDMDLVKTSGEFSELLDRCISPERT